MKTTLEISAPLFLQAKEVAAQHAMTFKALVERGLQMVIQNFQTTPSSYQYQDLSVGGEGLHPEFQNLTAAQWREVANDRDAA